MKRILTLALFLSLSFLAQASCDKFYPGSTKIQPFGATELCNDFFVTQYDETQNRALFSSELLAPSGHDLKRKDSFHSDDRLTIKIKPQAYAGTGFDRGHLVPADDATSYEAMHSTFLMSNMTPQNPKLNRGPWKRLEMQTRKLAEAAKTDIHVVTGATYENSPLMKNVPIPSGYYKIIYIEGRKPAAFYADNDDRSRPRKVKVSWLNIKTNMKFPED